ncbi:hypothetical protein LCGC14_0951730 [marine sediment metagenome]|uniref:HNH nuclease domain-containing protein n=1 Tax=marine sediment metagenome TaxID=412755 RepID=A0A0F9P372_9ZZZZ
MQRFTAVEIVQRYQRRHPERAKASKRRTYLKYREKWLAQGKAYRLAHYDQYRKYDKRANERRKADPVRLAARRAQQRDYYQRNRERRIADVKAYEKTNFAKVRVWKRVRSARRRTRLVAAPGTCSREQWLGRFQFYGGHCAYCPRELRFDEAQMEHRIPISRGGSNWPANIVPACADCNLRKGTKTSAEFGARILAA